MQVYLLHTLHTMQLCMYIYSEAMEVALYEGQARISKLLKCVVNQDLNISFQYFRSM